MNRIYIAIYFGVICFLSNCTISHKLFIDDQGSAKVITTNDIDTFFYKSSEISIITAAKGNNNLIEYSVKSIDSIGNYLSSIFNKNVIHFVYKNDSLLIYQSSFEVLKEEFDDIFCCNLVLEISSNRIISHVKTLNENVKFKKNKVIIRKTKKSFNYKNKILEVLIVFKN
jgi:hypothetical protein